MDKYFKNKVFFITGGTGSFGKAFTKFLLERTQAKKIIIYSRDEQKQFNLQNSKEYIKHQNRLRFFIGDIRDYSRLKIAMDNQVDYVIHAAALKHVSLSEYNPFETIKTNIIGSQNLIKCCLELKIPNVIALSTDKASSPINLYGASKLAADKLFVAANAYSKKNSTKFSVVRYGNVMASRGSVIPLFIDQIKNNKPITITDPSMTRFMMSLDDAVALVLFAFENGKSGDVFVQKAPAATIQLVANSIKKILGVPNHDVKIIGTRHGEKLYETLLTKEEMVKAIDMGEYYRIPADSRDLNYNQFFEEGEEIITESGDYHSHNTKRLDEKELTDMLLNLKEIQADIKEFKVNE